MRNSSVSIIIPFCNEMPQVLFTAQSLHEQLQDALIQHEIILVDNRSASFSTVDFGMGAVADENYSLPSEPLTDFDCYNKPWVQKIRQREFFTEDKLYVDDAIGYLRYDEKLSHWNAKNYGVSQSKYSNLLFLDSHCIVSANAVVDLLEVMSDPEYSYVGAAHMVLAYMMGTHFLKYNFLHERFSYKFEDIGDLSRCGTLSYRVPIMSTCGMMMKRDVFDEMGGWCPELGIYGGGEAYMGYKLGTCGYAHLLVPKAKCWHYAESRGYSWNLWDWTRNNFIAAYVVGGKKWLYKLRDLFEKEGKSRRVLDIIADNVLETCESYREQTKSQQVMTYDDYKNGWGRTRKNQIPVLAKESKQWSKERQ